MVHDDFSRISFHTISPKLTELTAPSQISDGINIVSQRLSAQKNTKKTLIKKQLNTTFEQILREITPYKNCILPSRKQYAENNIPSPSNPYKNLAGQNTHQILKMIKILFQSSQTNQPRQHSTRFGVVSDILDDTVIVNEERPEGDYHRQKLSVLQAYTQVLQISRVEISYQLPTTLLTYYFPLTYNGRRKS